MLVRKVFDRPPYLVPLQETWHGRHCGPAEVDDPNLPDHCRLGVAPGGHRGPTIHGYRFSPA